MNLCTLLFLLAASAAFAGSEPDPSAKTQPGDTASGAAASLAEAYRREFAFLDGQRRQLEDLRAGFLDQAAAQEKQLEGKIAALQRQILDLIHQVEQQEAAIADAEKRLESAQETAALWETTLAQAKATLEDYGMAADQTGSETERFEQLLKLALTALELGGTLHRQPASFFLPDGKKADGDILFLGNIAAYGISNAGSGILLPAGEGRFKLLLQPQGAKAAQALAAGQKIEHLPLFIFESLKAPVELTQQKTWRQVLDDGGPIAWIIAGLGACGLLLALARVAILRYAGQGRQLVQRVVEAVAADDFRTTQALLEQAKGAYPALLKASLAHLAHPEEEWEIAVSDALLQQAVRIDRFASLIPVIAAVAPLLGLLGTVTGMIETFDVITRFGTGDPKLLASGIAVALITTEVGLIAAIPLLLLGNLLNSWAGNLKTELELSALAVREAKQINGQAPQASFKVATAC